MAIGTGLVGFGLAGRYLHAPFLAPAGFALKAVATSRREDVAQDHPSAAVCAAIDGLLRRGDIDLIVIATPNDTHAPLAERALAAGKHVVVDKPMTVSVEEADALLDLADRAGKVLTVYHNRRWDSDFLTVREILASDELGRIALFESRWDRFRPQVQTRWREVEGHGGGVLNDLGPHLVDQALTLFGWPDWVQGDVLVQRSGAATDDGFSIRLGYGSTRAVLEVSSLSARSRPRFHLHGDGGAYLKGGLDPQEAQLRQRMSPLEAGFGEDASSEHGMIVAGDSAERRRASARGRWLTFWEGLRGAIVGGSSLPVDPAESRDALLIIATTRESARSGRRLVPTRPRSVRYRTGATHV